jgi:hypothetical protein
VVKINAILALLSVKSGILYLHQLGLVLNNTFFEVFAINGLNLPLPHG